MVVRYLIETIDCKLYLFVPAVNSIINRIKLNKYYVVENDTWDFVEINGKEYELVKLRKDKNDENNYYSYLKDGDGIEFFLCKHKDFEEGQYMVESICTRKSLNPTGDNGIYETSYPLKSYKYVEVFFELNLHSTFQVLHS